jgi:cell division protein FtsN
MARTENEQEMVLGNKQLLSAFFVVVALLGVFFTMGYVIGRNTTSTSDGAAKKAVLIDRPTDAAAVTLPVADSAPPPVAAIPSRTEPAHTGQDPPQQEARKAEASKKAEAPKKAEASKAEAPKPEAMHQPPPVVKAGEKAVDTSVVVAPAESTAGHTYLQLMAVKRPVADSTVKMLKGRGLPALLGESSRPELYRVLVGPYGDTESLAKAKTELKKMGFDTFISK